MKQNRQPDNNNWPHNVEEAVLYIIERLEDSYKDDIKRTPYESLRNFNLLLGMTIRNKLGLWQGNVELIQSCMKLRNNDEKDPDLISLTLIEEVWKVLNGQKTNLNG